MDIWGGIRRSFWRGLAALLPALLTFIVLSFGISLVQSYMGKYVNDGLVGILNVVAGEDLAAWYDRYLGWWLEVVLSIVGLCVAAYLVGTFIGGYLLRIVERWLVRMPVLRKIYPGAKQVSDFLFSKKGLEFRRVVAIEYPRKGLWTLGFMTGRSFAVLSDITGHDLFSVFVPSTPTPITGYVVSVPREDIVEVPISVDEAFEYMISAGVIMPAAERIESLAVALQVSREEAREVIRGTGVDESPDKGSAKPEGPAGPAENG
jgi:uncharacterized membrane protein